MKLAEAEGNVQGRINNLCFKVSNTLLGPL